MKVTEILVESRMGELHSEFADVYHKLTPKIERHKDAAGAEQLYQALKAVAVENNAVAIFKDMLNAARNAAHMDYDTNPGGFENWFWYLPFDDDLTEGANDGKEDNFTIDDIKNLERIRDFETLKAQAKELIKGKPARRMKPEKISWFYNHIDTLKNPLAVIKMMYDLMLAGEGNKVIGSRNSMSSNSYRQRFGEQGVAEGIDPYRLERLDPQTRRVLIRMGDHKEPGSWLSASEAYALTLGLQHKNRDPRGWEQEVQHFVDLYRRYSGQGVAEGTEPTEQTMNQNISDLVKDAMGARPTSDWMQRWMAMSVDKKLALYQQLASQLD
jgi:hypothetical protein